MRTLNQVICELAGTIAIKLGLKDKPHTVLFVGSSLQVADFAQFKSEFTKHGWPVKETINLQSVTQTPCEILIVFATDVLQIVEYELLDNPPLTLWVLGNNTNLTPQKVTKVSRLATPKQVYHLARERLPK